MGVRESARCVRLAHRSNVSGICEGMTYEGQSAGFLFEIVFKFLSGAGRVHMSDNCYLHFVPVWTMSKNGRVKDYNNSRTLRTERAVCVASAGFSPLMVQ